MTKQRVPSSERSAHGEYAVEALGVVKRYGRTLALAGVDVRIGKGERYAILGPNGAGKTTLIHILCTIESLDDGTVHVGGTDVIKAPRKARRGLGVVFQEPSLDTRLTVGENLEFHGRVYGVPSRLRKRRIDELLDVVELGDWKNELVRTLSRGMQRRLEIARALVHDASLLVLDEPTVGLDAQTRARMWDYITTLQADRGLTVLATTHYIEEVDNCDRVCIIDNGKVLTIGTPDELKEEYGRTMVRVVTADTDIHERVVAQYESVQIEGDAIEFVVDGQAAAMDFLREHGASLSAFTVERTTLEGVFLELTGSGLRDRSADGRDRLLAFGRQGGEHTR